MILRLRLKPSGRDGAAARLVRECIGSATASSGGKSTKLVAGASMKRTFGTTVSGSSTGQVGTSPRKLTGARTEEPQVFDLTGSNKTENKRRKIGSTSEVGKLECPAGIDQEVFEALPRELQLEAIEEIQENQDVVSRQISVLSYNVWFREELALVERMQGVLKIIAEKKPMFFGFQEVTANILMLIARPLKELGYDIKFQTKACTEGGIPQYFVALGTLKKWEWTKEIHFPSSSMGRCLLYGQVDVGNGSKLIVGTSHLESPIPPFKNEYLMSKQRKEQIRFCFQQFSQYEHSCVFLGDMNWDEGGRPYLRQPHKLTVIKDGVLPLENGWKDSWVVSNPDAGFEESATYNLKTNAMLRGSLCCRLDRILYRGLTASGSRMVGTKPIPGVHHTDSKTGKTMPVLPSDHYGLLSQFTLV
mmetsp:Transcript_12742/g.20601  ORF Transcript_12742/g.20601 Transcript_12742/m.20601 type:complete len:418 (-) Transcript_12742:1756-3009(-)